MALFKVKTFIQRRLSTARHREGHFKATSGRLLSTTPRQTHQIIIQSLGANVLKKSWIKAEGCDGNCRDDKLRGSWTKIVGAFGQSGQISKNFRFFQTRFFRDFCPLSVHYAPQTFQAPKETHFFPRHWNYFPEAQGSSCGHP